MHGTDYQRIATAIQYLEAHVDEQPALADLAGRLGLSEGHAHRMFKKWAGITPKDFLQVLTLVRAKRLLARSHGVLDVSLELGLSGSARLHDLFVTHEAMTPGEYKGAGKGVVIHWSRCETPFGMALVAVTARGVCALSFDEGPEALRERWPRATLVESAKAVGPYMAAIGARMRGERDHSLELVLRGSAFQIKVWEALLSIPEGQVLSYGELAARLGMPRAARAVGTAVAENPIGFLIPCHRVIRATGVIGEYRWGSDRKELLLAVEGARGRS